MTEKKYFNFKQTSEYLASIGLKIGEMTIRQYNFYNEFCAPTIIAGKKLFEKSDIDAWIANRTRKPGSGRPKKGGVMKSFNFIRVSTEAQTGDGQALAFEKYKSENPEWEHIDILEKISGATPALLRPILQGAIANLTPDDRIVFYDISRISRAGIWEFLEIFLQIRRTGAQIITLAGDMAGDNGDEFLQAIQLLFYARNAQQERIKIRDRTMLGRAKAVQNGAKMGTRRRVIFDDKGLTARQTDGAVLADIDVLREFFNGQKFDLELFREIVGYQIKRSQAYKILKDHNILTAGNKKFNIDK